MATLSLNAQTLSRVRIRVRGHDFSKIDSVEVTVLVGLLAYALHQRIGILKSLVLEALRYQGNASTRCAPTHNQ
jgi:GTP-sensing pleiotropic transcriptional regulator CodY